MTEKLEKSEREKTEDVFAKALGAMDLGQCNDISMLACKWSIKLSSGGTETVGNSRTLSRSPIVGSERTRWGHYEGATPDV